jgi:phosphate transport system permease protein
MRRRTMAGTTAVRPSIAEESVRRRMLGRRLDLRGLLFEGALLLSLLLALLVLLVLLSDIFRDGWPVLRDRGANFINSGVSSLPERAGVRQGIVGSLTLMAFVVILAFPLGIGAAVYLEEYAPDTRLTRWINANVRNLAGVPSIVYGLLGVVIFVQLNGVNDITGGRSAISGGLTMGILVLPIVVITAAEALRAVPQSIREAGYGVGATRWEVVRSHVLPYAAPGIFTGTILTLARAFGETAPLIMIGAATGFLSTGSGGVIDRLQGPYTALPTLVYSYVRRSQRAFGPVTASTILVMLVILLLVNVVAIVLRNRYERTW